jgi:hypothetical protein
MVHFLRYDWVNNKWIYNHDGVSLHRLLETEFRQIYKNDKIDFVHLEEAR